MAKYIKANPKVAAHLGLTGVRNMLPDGNFLLWQADMLAFGSIPQLAESCAMIGALILAPHEAREEQDGVVSRQLPEATDERFFVQAPVEEEKNDEEAEEAPVTPDIPNNPTTPTEEPSEAEEP